MSGNGKTPPGGRMRWTYELRDDPKVTGSTLLVGYALASFMPYDGECRPSVPRIAGSCGLSGRSVQRSLRRLERLGYLEVEYGVGRGEANLYKAAFQKGDTSDTPPELRVTPVSPLSPEEGSERVTPMSPGRVKGFKELKPAVIGDRAWQDLLDPDLLETARRLTAGAAVARSAESGWVGRAGVIGR